MHLDRGELKAILIQCMSESDFKGTTIDFLDVELGAINELEEHWNIQVFGKMAYADGSTQPVEALIALYESEEADILKIKET